LHHGHVSDEVYARAAAVFTERELAQVIAMAVTINAWNRFNVATRMKAPRR
jgi:alkylhydroperoxidase family enzyme